MRVLAGIVCPHCYVGNRPLAAQVVQTGSPTPGLEPIQKAHIPIRYFSRFLLREVGSQPGITFNTWLPDTMHVYPPISDRVCSTPRNGKIAQRLTSFLSPCHSPNLNWALVALKKWAPTGNLQMLSECKSPWWPQAKIHCLVWQTAFLTTGLSVWTAIGVARALPFCPTATCFLVQAKTQREVRGHTRWMMEMKCAMACIALCPREEGCFPSFQLQTGMSQC